jgi:hypothetical protein
VVPNERGRKVHIRRPPFAGEVKDDETRIKIDENTDIARRRNIDTIITT